MKSKPFVIACIPAYNEEKTIAKVILQTRKYVDKIIVCDDGSSDMTGEIAKALGAIVIKHEKNMGYGAALSSLFNKAIELNADIIITIDADEQHDPKYIPQLVKPLVKGKADIVIGSRFLEKTEIPRYRKLGIKIITKMAKNISYDNITDAQSGLRAYTREALIKINPEKRDMSASIEILAKAKKNNLKIIEIPVKIKYNVEKPSKKNPITHMAEIIVTILRLTLEKRPLTYLGIPAGILYIISFYSGIQLINLYLKNRYFSIPYALIAIITFITALILTTTAIQIYILLKVIKQYK